MSIGPSRLATALTVMLVSGAAAQDRQRMEFKDCGQCPLMVVLPAGSYMMGSLESELGRSYDERPWHQVTLNHPFAVGRYEVTFDEWDACVADGGCNNYSPKDINSGHAGYAVSNVNWQDAQAYLTWLNKKTGGGYRLLTEAEWEYAARAGSTTPFYWGLSARREYENYGKDVCCGGAVAEADMWLYAAPVGSFEPNRFGLYDILGNVSEWTEDCYDNDYDRTPRDGSAYSPVNCPLNQHVYRGGSFQSAPDEMRVANRGNFVWTVRNAALGFRVAKDL